MKKFDHLCGFIQAREDLRTNRSRCEVWPSRYGDQEKFPWTRDPILKRFHFCNINREHDRVTIWVAKNVRSKFPKLSLTAVTVQLVAARIFNDPPVLEEILPFRDAKVLHQQLHARQKRGEKIFRGAYMMVPNGVSVPSATHFAKVMGKVQNDLDIEGATHLEAVADALMEFHSVGNFLSNQVCTDLRYLTGARQRWRDWETFVLAGPGTKRGLNRLHGRGVKEAQGGQTHMFKELTFLRQKLRSKSKVWCLLFEDPNNVANSLCEYDKYCRASDMAADGEQVRLKRIFVPHTP